ncbi:MAG: hypothetical protein VX973_04945, partial [Pseudomonadota bacterium]|nr:hypothetical protein [Pseudomonadota bacterium]
RSRINRVKGPCSIIDRLSTFLLGRMCGRLLALQFACHGHIVFKYLNGVRLLADLILPRKAASNAFTLFINC